MRWEQSEVIAGNGERMVDFAGCSTVEPRYNEQKASQHLNLISTDFDSYGNGEHSNIPTRRIGNNLEHCSDLYLTW